MFFTLQAIIWDDSLAGPVGLVAKYVFLKEHNVTKMFPLTEGPIPEINVKSVIYITRPTLKLMDYIADNLHCEDKKSNKSAKKDFYLYFVPRRSELCEQHLIAKGVFGTLTHVGEFKCNFFPVDNDVLSMELKDSYRELHIEGDPTCLYQSAQALVALQKLYGRIPKIYGKGKYAESLWELTKNLGREDTAMLNSEKGSIDQLVIIDRSIDLMSVLATQLTYEGLIDECFGINNTTASFPPEKFASGSSSDNSQSDKKVIILNSGEDLYTELRDKNFNEVSINFKLNKTIFKINHYKFLGWNNSLSCGKSRPQTIR